MLCIREGSFKIDGNKCIIFSSYFQLLCFYHRGGIDSSGFIHSCTCAR